jgi:hypothetical protein
MIALSIRQPWAGCILYLGKDVENRTWPLPPKFRGRRVLIHAGARPDALALKRFSLPEGVDAPLGGIVGVVRLVGCYLSVASPWAEPDRFNWLLADAKPLPFFPCKGRLGFFEAHYPFEVPS